MRELFNIQYIDYHWLKNMRDIWYMIYTNRIISIGWDNPFPWIVILQPKNIKIIKPCVENHTICGASARPRSSPPLSLKQMKVPNLRARLSGILWIEESMNLNIGHKQHLNFKGEVKGNHGESLSLQKTQLTSRSPNGMCWPTIRVSFWPHWTRLESQKSCP